MIDFSFLRLKKTIEAAHDLQESPIVQELYLGQVQLLPQDTKPYYFNTNQKFGQNTQAFLVDCNGQESDISAHFNFFNFDNYSAFRLAYLPIDYGAREVYLKITSSDLPTLYSNWFKVTRQDEHLTSRIDYKTSNATYSGPAAIPIIFAGYYQSVRLAFYKKDHVDRDEIGTYLAISIAEHINTNAIHTDLIEWQFDSINSFTHKRLKRALQKGVAYINFVRNTALEAFEYEEREALSNISTLTFLTDQDESDLLVVDDVIIATDGKQANWVFIDGDSVQSIDNNNLVFIE